MKIKFYLLSWFCLFLGLKGQAQQITLHVTTAGTLSDMIAESRVYAITDLKLTGQLNGTDIHLIRKMGGCDHYGIATNGKLEKLDLSGAQIVNGGDFYYMDKNNIKYTTTKNQIGKYMFISCNRIKQIDLPKSITSIEEQTFSQCTNLTEINIPETVTSIGDYAFYNCNNLSKINIPKAVTSIGEYAFGYCTSLTEINIPETVNTIGSCAFSDCTSLTQINIPKTVTTIEISTFSDCTSLTQINIPQSVKTFEGNAFFGCGNLKSVYMNSYAPPTMSEKIPGSDPLFYGCPSDLIIYVPREAFQTYWLSDWGNYNLVAYDPVDDPSDDIKGISAEENENLVKYYSIDGRPLPGPCKGVNIIQGTDGKTRKVWIP